MAFEPVDRIPLVECAYWPETLERWYAEGLPRESGTLEDVNRDVGLDHYGEHMGLQTRDLDPPFEEEILEEHEGWVLRRNINGTIEQQRTDGTSMRCIVQGVVQTRSDWEEIKRERLRPDLAARVPDDWEAKLLRWRTRDYPLHGMLSEPWLSLVELLGAEQLLTQLCADPGWVHEMFDFRGDFFVALSEQLLAQIVPEICWIGGDFCCTSGPLMSPAMFGEFFVPTFKRITSVYRSHGVPVILVHTDGDFRPLADLFRESGAMGVHPCEVTNGQNVADLRRDFPDMAFVGGVDKREIAKGRDAIDRELAKRMPVALESGGYIPHIDHSVPPDISLDDFRYYRSRLAEMAGVEE